MIIANNMSNNAGKLALITPINIANNHTDNHTDFNETTKNKQHKQQTKSYT